MRMVATDAVEPVDFVPAAQVVAAGAAARAGAGAPTSAARFASGAGSATASIGRCARLALRRTSPPNISLRWRPRSTSARSAPNDGFDMVLGAAQSGSCFTRGSTAPRHPICSWCGGARTAASSGSMRRRRPSPRRSKAGRCCRSPGTSRPTSATAITRSCTSPASTPASTSAPAGAARSSPRATARSSRAGWAGGYGRQVRIAHAGGLVSSYGHMSEIVARAGQLRACRPADRLCRLFRPLDRPAPPLRGQAAGTPVNPLGVRFSSAPMVNTQVADAVKARLKALLSVGVRRS